MDPESTVDDFGNRPGAVGGRAATTLRSTEAHPELADSIGLYNNKDDTYLNI
jgi:hypothetical protein